MSRIKIFKNFDEQELYQIEKMRNTTAIERFRKLFYMQKLSSKFHTSESKPKKIMIYHGYPPYANNISQ